MIFDTLVKFMRLPGEKKRWSLIALILILTLATYTTQAFPKTRTRDLYLAQYSQDNNNIFWFVQISDIHMGQSDEQDSKNLEWIVRAEGKETIDPEFIVATGDLTDSTNGGIIPNGPYLQEWQEYLRVLGLCLDEQCTEIDTEILHQYRDFYYDIPGNHDHYGDKDFDFYLNWSVRGLLTSESSPVEERTQTSWLVSRSFGQYRFIGVNTAGDDGRIWSISPQDYFGDHAGLRGENTEGKPNELQFIENQLKNGPADLTIILGHHPIRSPDLFTTGFEHGAEEFISLLREHGVSAYHFGHVHESAEAVFTEDPNWKGVIYLSVASLGKSIDNHYNIVAIDNNGISTVTADVGQWPVVLITAPVDKRLGGLNPYAYPIPISQSIPIRVRALIFTKHWITKEEVKFRYSDLSSSSNEWHDIVDDKIHRVRRINGENSYLWEAEWETGGLSPGEYMIEVQAIDHFDTISVEVQHPVDISENGCFIVSLLPHLSLLVP